MSTSSWSEPAEHLLQERRECDVLVIGSGYGGSVAAATLANGSRKVWVLERGREYRLGEFPQDIGELPGHVRLQRAGQREPVGRKDALFDVRSFEGGAVLLGSGLGGGSLVNAGVALRPDYAVFREPHWPAAIRQLTDQQLDELFKETEDMLGAGQLPDAQQLPKFQALARLARSIGATAAPAPLTIAADDLPAGGDQPVDLQRCVRCGNCFTGCNYGAKRTLATNLIPRAVRHQARFFTGAEAMHVTPLPAGGRARYRVHFRLVADRAEREYTVDAHTVIVSAGTLGSTELLMRSRAQGTLAPSTALGERFSANGDAIAMGWGQREEVRAFAREASPGKPLETGPTITGFVRTRVATAGGKRSAFIQDGAVPQALGPGAVALGSTLSLFHRYVRLPLPGFFQEREQQDWVATPQALRDHAQLLLAMGEDESDGRMAWDEKAGRVTMERWPASGDPKAADFQQGLHALFRRAGARGFDDGDYLPNPMWRALPDDFAEVAGEGAQGNARVTVHPLGGCGMAEDARGGVVDALGTVFRADGGVYEGLHVLDGAILPCATGANPFLTIAALSLRAARHIAQALPAGEVAAPQAIGHVQPRVEVSAPATAVPVHLSFRETLAGRASGKPVPGWLQALLQQEGIPAGQLRSWAAVVEVQVPLDAWLDNPSQPLQARLRLWGSRERVGLEVDDALLARPPLLEGEGRVSLLALDAPGFVDGIRRSKAAIDCFGQRRPGETQIPSLPQIGAARATLRNHTLYRELRYEFEVTHASDRSKRHGLAGTKRLAYAPGQRTLWDALLQLPLELRSGESRYAIDLEVDVVDMLRNNRLQVTQAPSTPAAIVGLAAFAAQWGRALVQTHFWSFRGLDYPKLQPRPAPPPPEQVDGCARTTFELPVPLGDEPKETIRLELHRYAPAGESKGCILLIHGLAHGSGVFTTDTIEVNLVQHFLRQRQTVWLLDHRLSNRLPHAANAHTIDDVARHDIAEALRFVFKHNGYRPFQVFAHCVGAAAFAMAVLRGDAERNDGTRASMVSKAILHAVHPWVVPSASNRFSAALAALYKDLLPADTRIDPVPTAQGGDALDHVIDRIAATLPWPDDERQLHEAGRRTREEGYAVCNRMTLFYGREWRHENLAPATHERLSELVGVGGLEVFRQLFFIALRKRLTDRGGENAYLTQPRLEQFWTFPTLFAHGSDNRVFDVRSAVQAWKRLTMVHALRQRQPGPAVGLFVPAGRYGHMDFLFGRDAARDVYPRLTEFLQAPDDFRSSVQGVEVDPSKDPVIVVNAGTPDEEDITDRMSGISRRPICGPMVQVESAADGRRLVLWCEQACDATSQVEPPGVRIDGRELGNDEAECTRSEPSGAGVCWLIVVKESARVPFAQVQRIELLLKYDGAVPLVTAMAQAWREQAEDGLKGGFFNDKLTLAALDAQPLQPLAFKEPELPAPPPPVPPDRWLKIEVTGLEWWKRWSRRAPGPVTAFLAASCRWPGLAFERDAVHRLAVPMLAQVERTDDGAAQGLVLLGDQIYVDATANVTETTEPGERGPQRYRDAWQPESPSGRLLARVPCWMVVDDHEFGDDVGEFAQDREDDRLLTLGFDATRAFQWRRQAPQPMRLPPGTRPETAPPQPAARGFWYEFEIGGLPAFAADTRTERRSRADAATWERATIMGDEQARALEAWLLAHRAEPKILCSGSVFGLPTRRSVDVPATRRYADDWTGYPASVECLVKFIVDNDVRNLVFLSGDYHLSAMARLTLAHGGKSVDAVGIVCSGWNATLPFANAHAHEFAWNQDVVVQAGAAQVTSHARMLSDASRQFGRVCIRPTGAGHQVDVEVFDEKGTRLETGSLVLS